MKKSIFSLTAVITPILLSCAFPLAADTTHIQAGIGYRQDSITLDLKDHGSVNPKVKSERHFKNLDILLLGAKLKTTLGSCDAYIRGSFDYGFVLNGKLRDNLNIKNRRETCEFHRNGHFTEGHYLNSTVHNKVKSNSYVWDADIAFAYPIQWGCEGFEIAPAVGFTVDRQQLHVKGIRNGCDESSPESDAEFDAFRLAKTHGHKSSLSGTWWSPWIGFDFTYNTCDCWDIYGTFEFHVGNARRHVSSSTSRKFVDNYKHSKTFYGPLFKLGTIYMFCENLYADANITYWKYFSNVSRDHLSWASGSIRLDIGYVF